MQKIPLFCTLRDNILLLLVNSLEKGRRNRWWERWLPVNRQQQRQVRYFLLFELPKLIIRLDQIRAFINVAACFCRIDDDWIGRKEGSLLQFTMSNSILKMSPRCVDASVKGHLSTNPLCTKWSLAPLFSHITWFLYFDIHCVVNKTRISFPWKA